MVYVLAQEVNECYRVQTSLFLLEPYGEGRLHFQTLLSNLLNAKSSFKTKLYDIFIFLVVFTHTFEYCSIKHIVITISLDFIENFQHNKFFFRYLIQEILVSCLTNKKVYRGTVQSLHIAVATVAIANRARGPRGPQGRGNF